MAGTGAGADAGVDIGIGAAGAGEETGAATRSGAGAAPCRCGGAREAVSRENAAMRSSGPDSSSLLSITTTLHVFLAVGVSKGDPMV